MKTLLITLLLCSCSLTAHSQSPAMDRILNNIYNGLGNEEDWNATLSALDDIVDDLEDDDFSRMSTDDANDTRAELKSAQVFYDFFGEISPYSGNNYDLKEDDFYTAIRFLDRIGVDNSFSTYDSSHDFPVVKLELWEGNVTVLMVHNTSACLHKFNLKFSSGDSMDAGADAHTFRAYTTYGIDVKDPRITHFSAKNVDFRNGCK
jgi:hypothetical protein